MKVGDLGMWQGAPRGAKPMRVAEVKGPGGIRKKLDEDIKMGAWEAMGRPAKPNATIAFRAFELGRWSFSSNFFVAPLYTKAPPMPSTVNTAPTIPNRA